MYQGPRDRGTGYPKFEISCGALPNPYMAYADNFMHMHAIDLSFRSHEWIIQANFGNPIQIT